MRARTTGRALAGAILATAVGLGPATPAGAAVTFSGADGLPRAQVTGPVAPLTIRCASGVLAVAGQVDPRGTPCSEALILTVVADDAVQVVDGSGFDDPAFSATLGSGAYLATDLGGGDDVVTTSARHDTVRMGDGDDTVIVVPGGRATDDIRMDGGGGPGAGDTLIVRGGPGRDSVGRSFEGDLVVGGTPSSVVGVDVVRIETGAGDDTVHEVDLGATTVVYDGGAGADMLVGPPRAATRAGVTLVGGPGTNWIESRSGGDLLVSSSPTDTLIGGGGANTFRDTGPARVGRTLTSTSADTWEVDLEGDAAVRARSARVGVNAVVASLARTGRQELPHASIKVIRYRLGTGTPDRAVLDIAALPGAAQDIAPTTTQVVLDIVAPTGAWTVGPTATTFSGYERITYPAGTAVHVRAPFTDPTARFVHRVVRDLEMRIAGTFERQDLVRELSSRPGTTRAGLVDRIVASDRYRRLAIDRAFVDILRRGTDAAGRDYWADRLDGGLVTRRLRANLYGSPEYVRSQGGGTDRGYVTAAYRDILGRTASAADISFWVGEIARGIPRGTVADRFLNTSEARAVVISDLFLRFADRAPTASELATWQPRLGSSTSDGEVDLVRMLGASAAYHARPDV